MYSAYYRSPQQGIIHLTEAQVTKEDVAELWAWDWNGNKVRFTHPLSMHSANASLENLCSALRLPLVEDSIEAVFMGEIALKGIRLMMDARPVNSCVSVISFSVAK